MDATRLKRVEAQMQKDLAEIFRQQAQSRFPGVLFTVTQVKISPDFSYARVSLSPFPDEHKQAIMAWTREHAKLLKQALVARMEGRLRRMPELEYFLDESLEAESTIDRILREGGESPIQ